ncbi:MAG: CvpA family protein [Desulfovibrio sp.]|jgi:membrane protein required for colicin V production|nr:CvpA family protein [Desulfovibrio sp.]
MGQDIFDLIVILMLVFFAGRGFLQGFVSEVAGLVSILGGFWAAQAWHTSLAGRLGFISGQSWRIIAAYVLIFLAVILAVALLARVLQKILVFSFVSWVDKTAGALVGFAKGMLLCALVLIILQKFFPDEPFMKQSRTMPYLSALADQVRSWLPPELRVMAGL